MCIALGAGSDAQDAPAWLGLACIALTWHALACYVVQAAIDTGAVLKLRPEAIEAIPAVEYPLPAPRPMNSRMARIILEAAITDSLGGSSNMTKLQLLEQSWESQVAAYVQDLVHRKLI